MFKNFQSFHPRNKFICSIDGATPAGGDGGGAAPTSAPAAAPAASPAPASAPTAAAAPEPATSSSDVDDGGGTPFTTFPDNFESGDLDEIVIPELPTGAEPVSGAPPTDPASAAPPAPAAAAPAAQPPVPAAATPPAPAAAPPAPNATPASGSPPQSELEATLAGMTANAPALRDWLATNVYALSKEEKEALEADFIGNVPHAMARVHLENTKNTMNLIHTLVPKLVQEGVAKVLQTRDRVASATKDFFTAWPTLNEKDHSELVNQFARSYRSINPTAPRKDAIQFVGAAIHAHLGLPVPPPGAASGTPAAPKAPVPPPFAPARPGARQVQQTAVDEPFAGLGQTFDDDK